MKVYYAAVCRQSTSDPSLEDLVTKFIPELIAKGGCEIATYVYNPLEADTEIGFAELAENIQQADVFIGEMSSPSQTLGFQLAYALSVGKPALYIYKNTRLGKPDTALSEHPSRLFRIAAYTDLPTLEHKLKQFVKYSKSQMNSTRTSFMSTHRIDMYVSQTAKKMGTSKAEVIRQLLDDSINLNSSKI